jgi:hypothetical protein
LNGVNRIRRILKVKGLDSKSRELGTGNGEQATGKTGTMTAIRKQTAPAEVF